MLSESSYVDDVATAGSSRQRMIKLSENADTILKPYGFSVKEWRISGDPGAQKLLGLVWSSETDTLGYSAKPFELSPLPAKMTKRDLYSLTMSFYDPLGFLGPLIIRLKLVIRELATQELDWEDKLPEACRQEAGTVYAEMCRLKSFTFPRNVWPPAIPQWPPWSSLRMHRLWPFLQPHTS